MEFTKVERPIDELDAIPPVIDIEYPCESCGREAGPYSGRGRKPKFCGECKPSRAKSPTRASAKNTNAAKNAAMVLGGYNTLLCIAASVMQLPQTAATIAVANEGFLPMAETALATDPVLANKIAGTGSVPAWISLCAAYATFGASITPVLRSELKQRKT